MREELALSYPRNKTDRKRLSRTLVEVSIDENEITL